MKTLLLTSAALIAFAGNSILCRLALGEGGIDAASFTSVRLITGVLVLVLILKWGQPHQAAPSKGSWFASLMLFIYAIGFSFAYVSLETGTGALILFAAVQITILTMGFVAGHRLYPMEWLGAIIAFTGFTYLVLPGVTAPPLSGFLLMSAAGIAWGLYTLAGKGSADPLGDTAHNFFRTMPLVALLVVFTLKDAHLTFEGMLLAMLSGGLASAIGYTIWYMALAGITTTQAATLQLLVPVIAAVGGIVFAGEVLSIRLLLSAAMILGGILLVILGRKWGENLKA